jgi:hypothetical protein
MQKKKINIRKDDIMDFARWKKNIKNQLVPGCIILNENRDKNEYFLEIEYQNIYSKLSFNKKLQEIVEESLLNEQWEIDYHYIDYKEGENFPTIVLAVENNNTNFQITVFSQESYQNQNKIEYQKIYYSKNTGNYYSEDELLTEEEKITIKLMELLKEFEIKYGPNRLDITVGNVTI